MLRRVRLCSIERHRGPRPRQDLRRGRRPGPRPRRRRLHRRGRRVRGDHGPVRIGQEHAAPHRRRPRGRDAGSVAHRRRRPRPARRPRPDAHAPRAHRFVFQFFNLLPSLTALRERPPALAHLPPPGRRDARRGRALLEQVGLADGPSTCPARCPAASSSASPSRARSCSSPALSPTSRPATSTGGRRIDPPPARRGQPPRRPHRRDGHPRPAPRRSPTAWCSARRPLGGRGRRRSAAEVALWFAGSREEGLFVGLWVPSILAAGAFWIAAVKTR